MEEPSVRETFPPGCQVAALGQEGNPVLLVETPSAGLAPHPQPCAFGQDPGRWAGPPPSKAGAYSPILRHIFKLLRLLDANSIGSRPSPGGFLPVTPGGVGGLLSHNRELSTCLQASVSPLCPGHAQRSVLGSGGEARSSELTNPSRHGFRWLVCGPGSRLSENGVYLRTGGHSGFSLSREE